MRKTILRSLLVVAALAVAAPTFAASGKTQSWKNAIVNQFFRSSAITFPSALRVRLYSACPNGSGGAGTELSGNGYAAQTLDPAASGNWGVGGTNNPATAGSISNITVISFPTVTTSAWTVNCVALTDAAGTTMYYWGDVTSAPVTVNVGATASFANNALVITEAMNDTGAIDAAVAALGRPLTLGDIIEAWAEAAADPVNQAVALAY